MVFDGLDEVADITSRRDVVEEVTKGVNRLREVAASVQTIVTSRPAAFANSPGFPEGTFCYFQLASINRPLIDEYAEKWLIARRLSGKEASDVRRILRDKLDQPHLRELARNPMQLAILLSLIQTKGGSLPDKRTALYDSYVELFFNREAEKSSVVRDHRDLLIDIHRYLGWILHSESQTKRHSGSVSAERLRALVQSYLDDEGHDSTLAKLLFTGMVERVVALVSRVEGTYEFEVQPLREYFAARHLYDTAPYSPAGDEMRGTLPDRFDALARDFFWYNVTRFYAGCYSKGELASLVDRLEELARSAGFKYTSHPQSLAATLLSDWVFAQHPNSMRQVVRLLLDGIGLRQITSGGRRYHREEVLALPKGSGNEELVERCFELLRASPPSDYARMLVELIRVNSTRDKSTERWLDGVNSSVGSEQTDWMKYGLYLGVLSNLSNEQLLSLVEDEIDTPKRLYLILRSGQSDFVEQDESRFEALVKDILGQNLEVGVRQSRSLVDSLVQVLGTHRYSCSFQNRSPMPLSSIWTRTYGYSSSAELATPVENATEFSVGDKCVSVVNLGIELSEKSANEWATSLAPWNDFVENAREQFGDTWAFYLLANAGAGIRSKEETCEHAADLFDSSIPLCQRVRFARLRAGAFVWWESQLRREVSQVELAYALLVSLTWAGPSVCVKLSALIDEKLRVLDVEWWLKLSKAIQFTTYGFGQEKRDLDIDINKLSKGLSERMIVALSSRVSNEIAEQLFESHLAKYDGEDPSVLEFCQRIALRKAQTNPSSWKQWLGVVSQSYAKGAISDTYYGYHFTRALHSQLLPPDIAEGIVEHSDLYPIELVSMAAETCRQRVAEKVIPVGIVAEKQRWF